MRSLRQQQQQRQHQEQDQQQQQYASSIAAETTENDENPSHDVIDNSASTANVWKDLSLVYRLYQQCSGENLSVCLKVKLLTGLEKALRSARNLKLIEGIQFVRSKSDDTETKIKPILNEKDIEAVLPRALEAKEQTLNNMIFKRLANFLQDHTLQIKFPDIRPEDDNSNSVESRKKKDKKGGGGAYIMIPLLLGGTFVPIAYGALAMLAGKALIVSKLALVLASIIGIKKLLSGGGKESSHEVVVSGGHSGWGRDLDLAYNAWKPNKDKNQ
ncbi:osiris 8 [Glossina fuscipes fuscipes]